MNGNAAMSPRPSAVICRMTRGQVGAQDLRVGELRPGDEVVLGVEPDADAVGGAAAAALALVGQACETGSIGSRCTLVRWL